MDPATIILTALTTGAAASVKDTASAAVKDAYNGLKTLIQHKLTNKPKIQQVLTEHQTNPQAFEKAILEEHLDQDRAIMEAAQKVLDLVQPQQAAMGKYNVQITGTVQGYAQGDYQQTTMNFGDVAKE